MQKSLNLLLVGAGKWGMNYVSTLNSFPNIDLKIATRYNWKRLIDEHPDGVFICTHPSSHIEIANYALSRNIPTMIEKPLALSLNEANSLKGFSAPILVNNIHLFSETFRQTLQLY